MKVLSLFDGISGARQALKELTIDCDYYASEIDKYAMQISKANHPDIIQMGDVKNVGGSVVDTDLLIGGFPCQSFSIAGNRKGLEDERGQLFFEMIRILEQVKPKYFLFENVASMSKENQDLISKKLGVQPIMINSALLTAQQRKRLYWTNIPHVKQPKDKEIYLKDIAEENVDEKYYIKLNQNQKQKYDKITTDVKKSNCLTEAIGRGGSSSEFLTSCKKITSLYAIAQRGRYAKDGRTEQRFETSYSEKANALTRVQKDSMLLDDYKIRKLTPTECCRLQGFPDNYVSMVSNTQGYKALGNSFTVPVIKHILKNIFISNINYYLYLTSQL